VDTLGHLLALHVTPATADDRAAVGRLAEAMQAATGETIEVAFVDQGYTGEKPAAAARERGIKLEVVRLPEAKRGFVLLPRRWVVEVRVTGVPVCFWCGTCCGLGKVPTEAGYRLVRFLEVYCSARRFEETFEELERGERFR
jgi:transposase